MDGWIGGLVDILTHWIDGWMVGWMYEWMDYLWENLDLNHLLLLITVLRKTHSCLASRVQSRCSGHTRTGSKDSCICQELHRGWKLCNEGWADKWIRVEQPVQSRPLSIRWGRKGKCCGQIWWIGIYWARQSKAAALYLSDEDQIQNDKELRSEKWWWWWGEQWWVGIYWKRASRQAAASVSSAFVIHSHLQSHSLTRTLQHCIGNIRTAILHSSHVTGELNYISVLNYITVYFWSTHNALQCTTGISMVLNAVWTLVLCSAYCSG